MLMIEAHTILLKSAAATLMVTLRVPEQESIDKTTKVVCAIIPGLSLRLTARNLANTSNVS